MTKRALSLDDLVNHDENDKIKLQKMNENLTNENGNVQENQPLIRKTSIGIADINNAENIDTNNRSVDPVKREEGITTEQRRTILNVDPIEGLTKTTGNSMPLGNAVIQETTPTVTREIPIVEGQQLLNNITEMAPPKIPANQDEEETDTDDEIGGDGEINFDSGMTFDYDKQDRNSPQKPDSSRKTKRAKVEKQEVKKTIPKESESKPAESIPEVKSEEVATYVNVVSNQIEKAEETKHVQPLEINNNKDAEVKERSSTTVSKIFEEKSSSESKRNNIKKDLKVLNEISATSKPNKYKNVPIWARKWKPTINALQNINTNDFKIDSSILNIIPDDDLTKSIQDWVYATVYSIEPEMRQFIELEMKFGIIVESKSPERVTPPISSQAVYTDMDSHLTPNIDEALFKELNKYIFSLSELNENSGKFNIIESQTKDSVYRVGLSTQRPRFLRMSTDIQTGRVGQFIEKRHVSQLLLFSPKDSYDMKISLNLELPVPGNDPPEKYKSQTPVSERSKDRISYIHNDSCTRIDITKVQNHNQGVKGRHTEITHEVELEINTPALLTAFNNINTDSKEYASVIRTFLNNGTIIRRKLTSLSYEIFEGKKD